MILIQYHYTGKMREKQALLPFAARFYKLPSESKKIALPFAKKHRQSV